MDEMDRMELQEAYDTIKEWGADTDNFVAQNFRHIMCGGEASDNSIELYEFFMTQLNTVVAHGLSAIDKALSR